MSMRSPARHVCVSIATLTGNGILDASDEAPLGPTSHLPGNAHNELVVVAKTHSRTPIHQAHGRRQKSSSGLQAPVLFSIAEDLRQMEIQVLSLFGGLIGILLGLLLAWLATSALQVPFLVDPTIVVIAFAFSALVGIVFGYFPARRAASLDPIEALRRE